MSLLCGWYLAFFSNDGQRQIPNIEDQVNVLKINNLVTICDLFQYLNINNKDLLKTCISHFLLVAQHSMTQSLCLVVSTDFTFKGKRNLATSLFKSYFINLKEIKHCTFVWCLSQHKDQHTSCRWWRNRTWTAAQCSVDNK